MTKKKAGEKYLNMAFVNAMATVEICQQRIAALQYAIRGIGNHRVYHKDWEQAIDKLSNALYQDLDSAYQHVFMLATVTRKEEHMKAARQIAYRHFLSEEYAIMQLLNLDFEHPGSYAVKDEEEFRREIEATKGETG